MQTAKDGMVAAVAVTDLGKQAASPE